MTRAFLNVDDLAGLVAGHFGTDRRLTGLDRLTGGTKKGVYRLRLDDGTTTILYSWAEAENYWPPSESVPDDPFTDASGPGLFTANHGALVEAGVRVPSLFMIDRTRRYVDADLALLEDAGDRRLEALMETDPEAARQPLAVLGESLRRMHTTYGTTYGRVAEIGQQAPVRPAEDVILDRALHHVSGAAARDERIAAARTRLADHLSALHARVAPRSRYALIHGELGPDHILVAPDGSPVMIDIEGLTYFDVEWEHAFVAHRFGESYPLLNPVDLDPARMAFYGFAQTIALIEGPLRIAATDFPDREWMLDLADFHTRRALRAVGL